MTDSTMDINSPAVIVQDGEKKITFVADSPTEAVGMLLQYEDTQEDSDLQELAEDLEALANEMSSPRSDGMKPRHYAEELQDLIAEYGDRDE